VRPDELTEKERRIFDDGLVLIIKELHERLDAAVADAYGWPVDLAEEEVLARSGALAKAGLSDPPLRFRQGKGRADRGRFWRGGGGQDRVASALVPFRPC
jgi:hypothetical protein